MPSDCEEACAGAAALGVRLLSEKGDEGSEEAPGGAADDEEAEAPRPDIYKGEASPSQGEADRKEACGKTATARMRSCEARARGSLCVKAPHFSLAIFYM